MSDYGVIVAGAKIALLNLFRCQFKIRAYPTQETQDQRRLFARTEVVLNNTFRTGKAMIQKGPGL